jgi:hypothetical protein
MNLALTDAEALARALAPAERDGDESGLRGYSASCGSQVGPFRHCPPGRGWTGCSARRRPRPRSPT